MLKSLSRLLFVLALIGGALVPAAGFAGPWGNASSEAAAPLADWRVGPVATLDGAFAYCIAESRFDNGHSLVIARSRQGELNIGIAMSAAHLPRATAWTVTLMVGDGFKRQRQAVAADPDMLVIANGADQPLFEALSRSASLKISGPQDSIAYQLKDAGKAMAALKDCAERSSEKPTAPLGSVAASTRQLPPALKRLLAEAGFRKIGLLAAAAAPKGLGPADFVWKRGSVIAGMAELRTEPGQGLANLSGTTLNLLRERCARSFAVSEGEAANLPRASFRKTIVACTDDASTESHIAFLFEFSRGGLFKQFFFESSDITAASRDRDAIARVLEQAESH